MMTTTTTTQATEDKCCPANLKVGDGATMGWGSDCYPATVIEISANRRVVTIQADNYRVVSGTTCDGSAEYAYETNLEGNTYVCRYYRRNRSRSRGFRATNAHGCSVGLEGRRAYYNPSF
jgi:hypothetical protein